MTDISITLTKDEWWIILSQLAVRAIDLQDSPAYLPGSITKETYDKLRAIINTINENL